MRSLFITLLVTCLCSTVFCEEQISWPKLIWAVGQVESSGVPSVVSANGKYYGLLQCSRPVLLDITRSYYLEFSPQDMLHPGKAAWVFRHYGLLYKAKTAEDFCRIWKGGPSGKSSWGSLQYWYRVRALYRSCRMKQTQWSENVQASYAVNIDYFSPVPRADVTVERPILFLNSGEYVKSVSDNGMLLLQQQPAKGNKTDS